MTSLWKITFRQGACANTRHGVHWSVILWRRCGRFKLKMVGGGGGVFGLTNLFYLRNGKVCLILPNIKKNIMFIITSILYCVVITHQLFLFRLKWNENPTISASLIGTFGLLFDAIDTSGDGIISLDEYKAFYTIMGWCETLSCDVQSTLILHLHIIG